MWPTDLVYSKIKAACELWSCFSSAVQVNSYTKGFAQLVILLLFISNACIFICCMWTNQTISYFSYQIFSLESIQFVFIIYIFLDLFYIRGSGKLSSARYLFTGKLSKKNKKLVSCPFGIHYYFFYFFSFYHLYF